MAYKGNYTGGEVDAFLSRIENFTVDSSLSSTSTNPVQNKIVTQKLTELSERIEDSPQGAFMTSITHANLVNLKETSRLVAGAYYRITDYITTTAQANTQSAGNPFDVIVLALSEDTLAEEAYAIQSARDTNGYFANCNLSAWKLWYSLDNDTERFAWADTENGKGVIYRMIDEWNNDIPYDFKNIQYEDKIGFTYTQWDSNYLFSRAENLDKTIDGVHYYGYVSETAPTAWSEGECWITDAEPKTTSTLYKANGSSINYGGSIINVSLEYRKYYTFAEAYDLNGWSYENEIKPCFYNSKQRLNKICFGLHCYTNSFGYGCNDIYLGERCRHNSFGNSCKHNSFGDYCYYNSFGNSCYSNSFGDYCYYNNFGRECYSNSFGKYYTYNSLGDNCFRNNFGDYCYYNNFGRDCYENDFCGASSNDKGHYYKNNHFGDGVNHCTFINSATASLSQCVQNYDVARGLTNMTIEVTRNLAYETKIALTSSGELKMFNLADLA